jgi:hypothetical protein
MFFLPNIHLEICIYLNIFEESRKKLYKWKKTLLSFGSNWNSDIMNKTRINLFKRKEYLVVIYRNTKIRVQ